MKSGWANPGGKSYADHFFLGETSVCGRWTLPKLANVYSEPGRMACQTCSIQRYRNGGATMDAMEGLEEGDGKLLHQMLRRLGGLGLAASLLKAERKVEKLQKELAELKKSAANDRMMLAISGLKNEHPSS